MTDKKGHRKEEGGKGEIKRVVQKSRKITGCWSEMGQGGVGGGTERWMVIHRDKDGERASTVSVTTPERLCVMIDEVTVRTHTLPPPHTHTSKQASKLFPRAHVASPPTAREAARRIKHPHTHRAIHRSAI